MEKIDFNAAENDGAIHLEGDNANDKPGPTSDINLEESQDQEEIDKKKPDEVTATTDWEIDDNPYKERYNQSSTEVRDVLLPKIKNSEAALLTKDQEIAESKKLLDEAMSRLKDEQPEAYDNLTLRQQADKNARELAELKEDRELDKFVSKTPGSEPYLDAIRAHARAFPTKSLNDIWSESFKDVAEIRTAQAAAKEKEIKDNKVDKGGGATREIGKKTLGGFSEEEFNKLPVDKRRDIFIAEGIQL